LAIYNETLPQKNQKKEKEGERKEVECNIK
jgi:hypothetical protein